MEHHSCTVIGVSNNQQEVLIQTMFTSPNNMGNIMPQTWNDLENNPEYFPVYGVVEVGAGADFPPL